MKISHIREYVQTHCNDRRKTFHFACRQWYSDNNSTMMLYYMYTYSNTFSANTFIEQHFSRTFVGRVFYYLT